MKIASTDIHATNQLKLIENSPNALKPIRRSLIPITQNHYHSKVNERHLTYNSKAASNILSQSNNLAEKIEVKNLPKSGNSRLSIHNIEIERVTLNKSNNSKVISHYDSMYSYNNNNNNNNSNNAVNNAYSKASSVKRFETFHAKTTGNNIGGGKYLTQLKKNPSQRVDRSHNNSEKPGFYPLINKQIANPYQKQAESDLKSQTVLIKTNNNNSNGNLAKKESVSQARERNKNHLNDSSLSSLVSSSLSSDSNYSLSSETSIINRIEETKTVFDLINSIKLYLKKIEVSYSVENLFNFLKANVRNMPSNESRLTLDYLEQFKNLNNIVDPKLSKLQSKTDTNSLPSSQLSVNYPVPMRSISQLKPSVQHNLMGRKLINTSKPIKKLFKHLNLFRCLYHIMQRDLIVNVFLLEMPKLSNQAYNQASNQLSTITFMSSNDRKVMADNASSVSEQINSSINNETIKPSNQIEIVHKAKLKIAKKLRNYHEKIYTLNETLSVLINDSKSSDISLLSKHSILPVKFDYFKHGEFVLRLTIDIVKKFRLILNLCQKAYYLNFKLNDNNMDATIRLNTILDSSDYEDDYDDENDEIANHSSKLDNEIKRDTAVLKAIQRKKANPSQKLPTIHSKSNINTNNNNNNKNKLTPNEGEQRKLPHIEAKPAESEREKIIKNLTKQDSIESFIRETDTSSIMSENEDSLTYYPLNDDEYHEESNYLKQKVSSISSFDNPDSLLEEYRVYKQKLDVSQSTLRNLNFYLDNLTQRVDRYNYLEMQLKNDNELIKRTEMSLKQYQIDNMIEMNQNNNNPNSIAIPNANQSGNSNLVYVTKNSLAINLAFRKQLERQLDFLKYRFKLNMQDFNVEKVCLPEINYAIIDTEKKVANLSYYVNDLNKYLVYIEARLSEQFLNVQMRQQQHQKKQQFIQQQQKAQIRKPVSLARNSSMPTKANYYK